MAKKSRSKTYKTEVNKLIEDIESCTELREVLSPKKYALEGGYAFNIAKELLKDKETMNSNQMRKIFAELKRIENDLRNAKDDSVEVDIESKLICILPTVAYAVGRRVVNRDFYNLIKSCIVKIENNREDFKRFIGFYEALIAYSKYFAEVKEYKGGRR